MTRKLTALILAAFSALTLTACMQTEYYDDEESKASGASSAQSAPDSDESTGGTDSEATGSAAQTSSKTNSQSGPSGGTSSKAESIAPSTVDLRTAKFQGVTLTRIRWYEMGKEETQMIKDWEAKTGAKIKDEVVDFENVRDKIKQSINAGKPYDIGFLYGAFFPTDVIANIYKPIDGYIQQKYLVDTNKLGEGGFDLSKMNEYKWKNHYYGFSSYWDVDMLVMYYRKDVFRDYGYTDPNTLVSQGKWNWDTFYDVAQKIHNNSQIQMNGFSAGPEGKAGHENHWISGAGSSLIIDPTTKPTVNFSDAKFVKAMTFYQKITTGATAICKSGEGFQSGKAAMCVDGLYLATKMMSAASNTPAVVKSNWDIAPLPLSPDNKNGKYPTDWLKAVGIVNGSKNADAVASFALFKSKYKGDNKYDEYFTPDQIKRVEPYYKNISYANYGYGTLVTKFGQLFGKIAAGDNIAQTLSANKSVFQNEIDKVVK